MYRSQLKAWVSASSILLLMSLLFGVGVIHRSFAGAAATTASPAYPLKVSTNHRYLVDQNGVPFLIAGDSPQSMIGNISTSDAKTYFDNRKAHGYNAVWVNLLCDSYTGCNADGSTYDGIQPFTTPGDLSTPNPAYFSRVDTILNEAAADGIVVFLDPAETGGWLDTLRDNGVSEDYNYGVYLGNRYKNFPNIVWQSGNDFQTWDGVDDNYVTAVANGIRSVDPNHIQTIELNYCLSGSLDDPNWAPIISLDAAYTYNPTYAEVLNEYNRGSDPVFLVEAHYDGEDVGCDVNEEGTPNVLRHQEYWTMTSGAAGQLYGSQYWRFQSGWQTGTDSPGATQFGYMASFFRSLQWWNLVPDQDHTFVTAGYGTLSSGGLVTQSNYVTAALTPDGTLGVAYLPDSTTIAVNMGRLSGRVTA